ncbi:MAG: Crp/Fnr family transcriptional regulator [Ruminococcus sp.]|nr:Crp/Fnr family transcriptional regulator [Ruminococcus sp.]
MFDSKTRPGLSSSDLMGLNECFKPSERSFDKGEIITINSFENDTVGIIKSGVAYLSTTNFEGQRRILEYYSAGEFINFPSPGGGDDRLFYIIAKTKCIINMIQKKKLEACCGNQCAKHIGLIRSYSESCLKKSLRHVDIVSQRTLRGKLLTMFEYLSEDAGGSFTLPMPYTDLADYLAVDRSAMMRELKQLNAEGVITTVKRRVSLSRK